MLQECFEIFVDNFAGGGGASTGIELAIGRPVNIAINHDPDAVLMHQTNHPHTKHYCESVWDIDPVKACAGRPVALAWFSPDCKHFSKAKGGKPVEKNIRGLAWVVLRWAAKVRPRVIMLENVEEFKTWGPVRGGKPIKSRSGETFERWKGQLEALGYAVEMRELRACDYGAPTIRKRFFVVARCDGQQIVWPEPTHGAPESDGVKSGRLKPWRTAAEIIDWLLPCPSIFDTKEEIWEKYGLRAQRPLAEATMRRIARGVQKFVMDNPSPFIVELQHGNEGYTASDPLHTIKTVNHQYVATPIVTCIGQNGFSDDRSRRADVPLNTTVSKAEQCIVAPVLTKYHGHKSDSEARGQLPDEPIQTIDTSNRYGLVTAFMSKYFDGGYHGGGSDIDSPVGTVTAIDHNALCTAHLTKFQQNSVGQEPSVPLDTVMPGAHRFAVTTSNLVVLRNNMDGQSMENPLNTITASPGHFGEVRALLIKYYGQGTGQPIDDPVHTVTVDDRFGLVTIHGTQYAIVDIGLRMLTPRELFNANGFPPDYIIDHDYTGKTYTKAKQVARCGNAVPPPFAEALVRANLPEHCAKKVSTMQEFNEQLAQ